MFRKAMTTHFGRIDMNDLMYLMSTNKNRPEDFVEIEDEYERKKNLLLPTILGSFDRRRWFKQNHFQSKFSTQRRMTGRQRWAKCDPHVKLTRVYTILS